MNNSITTECRGELYVHQMGFRGQPCGNGDVHFIYSSNPLNMRKVFYLTLSLLSMVCFFGWTLGIPSIKMHWEFTDYVIYSIIALMGMLCTIVFSVHAFTKR